MTDFLAFLQARFEEDEGRFNRLSTLGTDGKGHELIQNITIQARANAAAKHTLVQLHQAIQIDENDPSSLECSSCLSYRVGA